MAIGKLRIQVNTLHFVLPPAQNELNCSGAKEQEDGMPGVHLRTTKPICLLAGEQRTEEDALGNGQNPAKTGQSRLPDK